MPGMKNLEHKDDLKSWITSFGAKFVITGGVSCEIYKLAGIDVSDDSTEAIGLGWQERPLSFNTLKDLI